MHPISHFRDIKYRLHGEIKNKKQLRNNVEDSFYISC